MDFTPTPGQTDVAALAKQVLGDRCTNERQKQVEAGGDRFDRELWAEGGSLGLLGIPLPEAYGGAGLGVLELTTLLVEAGRVVAPLPLAVHLASARLLAEAKADLSVQLGRYERARYPRTRSVTEMSRTVGRLAHLENPVLRTLRNWVFAYTPKRVRLRQLASVVDYDAGQCVLE